MSGFHDFKTQKNILFYFDKRFSFKKYQLNNFVLWWFINSKENSEWMKVIRLKV